MTDRTAMVDWIGDFLLCWSEDGNLPYDDVAEEIISYVESSLVGGQKTQPYLALNPEDRWKELENAWENDIES